MKSGVNINVKDQFGKTALHYAAENGHVGTTQLLMARGTDANMRDAHGNTALELALGNEHNQPAGALRNATSVVP